ncbi:Fpg/Nei family DNA glycosylase [Arcanobacterium ihumii]|uniref:Fpg/Nei family DNA glycosylase n=1 Tax=Arcanobacterium ihumii TaxID=2138162 RepID=UPI000F54242D|nr:endonuclease VIII [Arcanobacterium ihumii]
MPEGHSIHRLSNAITELFGGKVIKASSPQGRFTPGAELINDSLILGAQAWGKHLFIPFIPASGSATITDSWTEIPLHNNPILENDAVHWIHIHLGLYGSWTFQGIPGFSDFHAIGAPRLATTTKQRRIGEGDDLVSPLINNNPVTPLEEYNWIAPPPRETVRLRLALPYGVADLTGPNQCEILEGYEVQAQLTRLGPDPLRNEPGMREDFITRVRKRKIPIGGLVMDQKTIAGPGNIYRAECLFRIGIHPYRTGAQVSERRIGYLWDDLVSTMNDGVRTGKIWTVPDALAPVNPIEGDPEASRFAVYHRTGRPCLRCGSVVKEAEMQGRRLFWCSGCQR